MKTITPTVEQAIAACKDVETAGILGAHAVRVCRNTRYHLQKTVTREDVMTYYADNIHLNFGHCPQIVIDAIGHLGSDETGIYSLAGELIDGPRDYMTMDRVKDTIRKNITAYVTDLNKISAIV